MNFNRSTWFIIFGCVGVTVLVCVGCFFLSIVAFLITGSPSTTTTSRDREPPTPRLDRPFRVGQDVTVGEVRWKVLEATDLGNTLEAPSEFSDARTTAGRFIKVRFEIENLKDTSQSYGGVEVIDQQGRRFNNASEVFSWIEENERCILESLNPNLPKICTDIFELPPNASRPNLVVGDLDIFGSEEAQIDLGIQ